MSATMHQTRFVQVNCSDCTNEFVVPWPNHRSKELIGYGEQGNAFGFVSLTDELSVLYIRGRLQGFTGESSFTPEEKGRFHRVIVACADEIDGQSLLASPVCPKCLSRKTWGGRYGGDDEALDLREIPAMTFRTFESLSDGTKTEKIAQLWTSFRGVWH